MLQFEPRLTWHLRPLVLALLGQGSIGTDPLTAQRFVHLLVPMLEHQLHADYDGTQARLRRLSRLAAALQPTTAFQASCMTAVLAATWETLLHHELRATALLFSVLHGLAELDSGCGSAMATYLCSLHAIASCPLPYPRPVDAEAAVAQCVASAVIATFQACPRQEAALESMLEAITTCCSAQFVTEAIDHTSRLV